MGEYARLSVRRRCHQKDIFQYYILAEVNKFRNAPAGLFAC